MPTLEEVKQQINSLDGIEKLLGRKEIKELPNILWEDEKIEDIVQGWYEKGQGILVATNKRLIFVDRGMLWGLRVEDFPYDKMTSIQYETGMLLGTIKIFASGNKAKIEHVDKESARRFCEYIRSRTTSAKEHASYKEETKTESEGDPIIKLERLAKLRDQGVLTEEEFLAQKEKILGKI